MTDIDHRLQKIYAASNTDEVISTYDEWASDYDIDVLDSFGYVGPQMAVATFVEHWDSQKSRIIDVGCGTGLVGQELRKAGFQHIDGLDISREMLKKAFEKDVYDGYLKADLIKGLDILSNSYDAVISAGTFTHGHVGPDGLDELVRITRPGGLICITINEGIFESQEFNAKFDALERSDAVTLLKQEKTEYLPREGIMGHVVLLRVHAL